MTKSEHRRVPALTLVTALICSLLVVAATPARAYASPGDTERVSTASDGTAAEGYRGTVNSDIDMSPDGRWIAFGSDAGNLVPDDTVTCVEGTVKSCTDIFVKDRHTGKTTMVSVSSDGTPSNTYSRDPAISDDGRFVAFASTARNLVTGDSNGLSDIFVRDRDLDEDGIFDEPGAVATIRASVTDSGAEAKAANIGSIRPSISADGRHVVFLSRATNLVAGDTNNSPDVFVRDLVAETTTRISLAADGAQAEQLNPPGLNKTAVPGKEAISADGRFVLFQTDSRLLPSDTNRYIDVFVRDRDSDGNGILDEPGGSNTVQVNVTTDGAPARIGDSGAPLFGENGGGLSADGRFVVFQTDATNLVPGDTNLAVDVYVLDRDLDRDGVFDEPGAIETNRASVTSEGLEIPSGADKPSISPDGRFVSFASREDEIVPGDTNKSRDVFVHDRVTGATERASVAADGSEADHNSPSGSPIQSEAYSSVAIVSAGGRDVAFTSQASNLVAGQTRAAGTFSDVFVRHRGAANGVSRVQTSAAPNGLGISGLINLAGVRLVAQDDPANDASPGARDAGGEILRANVVYRPERQDLLVNIDVAHMAQLDLYPQGSLTPGVMHGLGLSLGDRRFEVRSLSPRDGMTKVFEGGDQSLFGPDPTRLRMGMFELFECAPVCLPVQKLQGGHGNTGDQIRIALPLESIGAAPGDALTDLRAFAAAAAKTDAGNDWDELDLGDATLPTVSIAAGIAPEEVPLQDVAFDTDISDLSEGRFTGSVDTTGLADGYYKVWARGCLGADACGAASTDVTIGTPEPKPTPTPTEEPSPTPADPSPTPSDSASPTPSASPTVTPSGTPSTTPTPTPTAGVYPTTPNDTYFSDLWATKRIGAPAAWQNDSATGFGIKVAVVDSGVDLQHEDLQCPRKLEVVDGSDLVDDDPDPDDKFGHGTHVAGIIGACTNNRKGTAGVAPDATIVPIRVLDTAGSGGFDDIAAGIAKATGSGAHIINLSLTGGEVSALPVFDFGEVDAAIEEAISKGVVVVAAAGNSGIPLCEYPALATDVICVGATDSRDLKAWYSSFPNKTGPGASLVAPGGMSTPGVCSLYSENIFSLYPKEYDRCDEDRVGYRDTAGTSMAAPHVAGTAALVYSRLGGDRNPANATKVIGALVSTAQDLGPTGFDPVFGEGIVNAGAAVASVEVGDPPDPDPTPTPTPTTPPAEPQGRTARVSEKADGAVANDYAFQPTLSADGRYVAFTSTALNLGADPSSEVRCPGGGLSCSDIFVKDHRTGAVTKVSVASDGTAGNASSDRPALSADGRFVIFRSAATNLVADDTNFVDDVFVHDRDRDEDGVFDEAGQIETIRVSVAGDGTPLQAGDRLADWPSISPDGRYVAFASDSSDLVPNDTNGAFDVFLRDLQAQTTERISVAMDGGDGDARASLMGFPSSISEGGRYIAFFSDSANLVPGDTNHNNPLMLGDRRASTVAGFDVFVRDRQKNETIRMSVAGDGSEMQGIFEGAFQGSMSADGRFVAFSTNIGTRLVPQDSNATSDIFVRDRDADEDGIFDEPDGVATRRVSVASDGSEATGSSTHPVMAADGGHVAFLSAAEDLVDDDHNQHNDVFVHDLQTGITDRASVTSAGTELDADAAAPSISGDGRFASFWTLATNLPGRPTRDYDIVYLRDRGVSPDIGEVVASLNGAEVSVAGWANLSGTTMIDLQDPRDDGLPGATEAGGQLTRSRIVYRGHANEFLVHLEFADLNATEPPCCVNLNEAVTPATIYGIEFLYSGVRYEARATSPSGSTSRFELYECVNVCLKTADLQGSFGTTGNDVRLIVPRAAFGAGEGDTLQEVHSFATAAARAFASAPLGNSAAAGYHWDSARLAQEVTIPAKEIRLGIAPAGTDRADVDFSIDATKKLSKQGFSQTITAAGLADGDYDVWAKACLGQERCGAASTRITIGDPDPEPVTPTTLVFSPRSVGAGQFSDEAFLEARLLDAQGAPISGAEITFELTGESDTRTFTAVTDAFGLGSKTVSLDLHPGAYSLTVRYAGRDDLFDPSADQAAFVIDKEDSTLTFSDEGRGSNRTFSAELTDLDTPASKISGATITFLADGEVMGTAVTNDQGRAELQAPPAYRGGRHEFEAVFDGDGFYEASTAGSGAR